MSKFDKALELSGLGAKYAATALEGSKQTYAKYGPINEEAVRITIRVCAWENCPPAMHAHTWMNEGSFRLYLLPNPNIKKIPENIKNPLKWDFGPLQINRGLYLENVRVRYFHGLPEEDVFGRVFYEPDGITPAEFDGNPLINAQAGARILMRTSGSRDNNPNGAWEGRCVVCGLDTHIPANKVNHEFLEWISLEEFRVGKYCGLDSRPLRVKTWREWKPYFEEFFKEYI